MPFLADYGHLGRALRDFSAFPFFEDLREFGRKEEETAVFRLLNPVYPN